VDEKIYEIKESHIADPGALGTAGFALTTMALSLVNAGIIPAANVFIFLPLALVYGGLAQILAGMWEFKKNNTFGAAVFTSYGSFWIAISLLFLFALHKTLPFGNLGQVLGWTLLLWWIPTIYFFIASFKTNWVLCITIGLLIIAFPALGFGNLAGASGASAIQLGGWCGILAAIGAWYLSAASVINSTFKKTVLSVGPIG
jgi:succinate-acetate transporter protein